MEVRQRMRLKANRLVAGYGRLPVVHGIDFEIPDAGLVAIVGPNGAGKTTLFKTLSHVIPPLSGELWLDDQDVSEWDTYRMVRAGVAYVPQDKNVFGGLSVEENLKLCGGSGKRANVDSGKAYEMFPALEGRATQKASTLSGGERQMLAIAQVMLMEPRLLLLDEPTSGLAPRVASELANWVGRTADSGVSVGVVVEQSPEALLKISDRVYVLSAGSVRFSGKPEGNLSSQELMQMFVD